MLRVKYNTAGLAGEGTLICCVRLLVLFSASERCSAFPEGDQVGPDDLSFVPGEDSTRWVQLFALAGLWGGCGLGDAPFLRRAEMRPRSPCCEQRGGCLCAHCRQDSPPALPWGSPGHTGLKNDTAQRKDWLGLVLVSSLVENWVDLSTWDELLTLKVVFIWSLKPLPVGGFDDSCLSLEQIEIGLGAWRPVVVHWSSVRHCCLWLRAHPSVTCPPGVLLQSS